MTLGAVYQKTNIFPVIYGLDHFEIISIIYNFGFSLIIYKPMSTCSLVNNQKMKRIELYSSYWNKGSVIIDV